MNLTLKQIVENATLLKSQIVVLRELFDLKNIGEYEVGQLNKTPYFEWSVCYIRSISEKKIEVVLNEHSL